MNVDMLQLGSELDTIRCDRTDGLSIVATQNDVVVELELETAEEPYEYHRFFSDGGQSPKLCLRG